MSKEKEEILKVCKECGFPLEWRRDIVILDDSIFSLMECEENTCKECGHQRDGYTITKIQSLLRKFRNAGKQEAIKKCQDEVEREILIFKKCVNNCGNISKGDKGIVNWLIQEHKKELSTKLEDLKE